VLAPPSDSQSLEIVSLWEDAVCLHTYQNSLISPDLLRAKKRLAKLTSATGVRQFHDHPFSFYRICVIIARRSGSATMGELSEALRIPLSSATRIVNHLSTSGYIARLADPNDHRIVRVALTDEGQRFYTMLHDFAKQRVQTALHHLTSEERQQLVNLMRKVIPVLTDMG
jgi:DNA-binding MarR family transcriptional regulator